MCACNLTESNLKSLVIKENLSFNQVSIKSRLERVWQCLKNVTCTLLPCPTCLCLVMLWLWRRHWDQTWSQEGAQQPSGTCWLHLFSSATLVITNTPGTVPFWRLLDILLMSSRGSHYWIKIKPKIASAMGAEELPRMPNAHVLLWCYTLVA